MAGTGQKQPERGEERFLGEPPPGMGPTLEGHKFSTKSSVKTAGMLCAFGFVFICFYSWLRLGSPFAWMSTWWLWLLVLALGAWHPLLMSRGDTVMCGADWLKKNKTWVELYDLAEVKVKNYGVRFYLELTDRSERKISCDLVLLKLKPLIWNYTYNGIVHSIVEGNATANKIAIGKLNLPLPKTYTED